MAFVPTVESAQKSINTSRVIYQDAVVAVAEGRAKLQAAVDSGQVQPGTQEYLNLKNQLVNSAEAQAETAKMQYDQDLSNLDNARAYAAGDTGVLGIDTGNNNYVAPAENPQVSNNTPPIVGAGEINVSTSQVNNNVVDNNPGFVYNNQGELVPADSTQGAELVQEQTATADVPLAPPPAPEPAASDVETIPKPVPSSALADLQAASNTQDIANFGTTAPPVNLESDAVLAARNASNTDTSDFLGSPKPVIGDGVVDAQLASNTDSTAFTTGNNFGTSEGDPEAVAAFNQAQQAKLQPTISAQQRNVNNGDWRVRLTLAPGADYLYNATPPGPLLQPLKDAGGVIFPYTPTIDTQYRANYSNFDLTHSNYRGYFYQNSYVDAINIRGTFTAQDTQEANYLLGVIHFFRSVTKMFYGQDAQRGAPPPLVFLWGLGQYQFNNHPCLVQAFNYSLPSDVDYIRAGTVSVNNTNLNSLRNRATLFSGGFGGILGPAAQRLANSFLPKGGQPQRPAAPSISANTVPSYVPTKMEIALTLLPVQSRSQVSQQFSLKSYANGDLLKGGFW